MASSKAAAATPSDQGYPEGTILTSASLKPYYNCSKKECVQELGQVHQVEPNKDLSLPELQVLLRQARIRAGMISANPRGKGPTDDMDAVKSATLPQLKEMCNQAGLTVPKGATVGELRLMMRTSIIEGGTGATVLTIGQGIRECPSRQSGTRTSSTAAGR